jgi:hypothetical protein
MKPMKFMFVLILIFALLAGGCIGNLGGKVPVMYVNVTMGETNGTMVIDGIEAHTGEVPKLQDPGEQLAKDFPAVYVNVVQNMMPQAYQTGKDYVGPGVYNYTLGFQTEINKTTPMIITVQAINKTAETVDLQAMYFNWTTETQSKTFK